VCFLPYQVPVLQADGHDIMAIDSIWGGAFSFFMLMHCIFLCLLLPLFLFRFEFCCCCCEVVGSWLRESRFMGRGLVEGWPGGAVLELNPACSLSASIVASLAALRALAAASCTSLAARFDSTSATAADVKPRHWQAWMTFLLKASSLVSFSEASDSAACSDAVVMALARSQTTTSPSVFLIISRPVTNAVYSTLTWYMT
jgi:hypothetical protein